jgi:hypothetical protein
MCKSAIQLSTVFFVTFFVAAGYVQPTPPGGVAWPYFAVMLFIPLAAYRFANRLSVAICYGLACGLLLAWPVFIDSRTPLRAGYGIESETELFAKITFLAVAVSSLCTISYGLACWRRRLMKSP